jgi:hypothetical protein
LTNLIL